VPEFLHYFVWNAALIHAVVEASRRLPELGDPSRREALGRAAREAVARRYDRRRIVAQVKDEMSGRPAR
jgi:hypothetical protein